jgi:hypothetical protein
MAEWVHIVVIVIYSNTKAGIPAFGHGFRAEGKEK